MSSNTSVSVINGSSGVACERAKKKAQADIWDASPSISARPSKFKLLINLVVRSQPSVDQTGEQCSIVCFTCSAAVSGPRFASITPCPHSTRLRAPASTINRQVISAIQIKRNPVRIEGHASQISIDQCWQTKRLVQNKSDVALRFAFCK